MPTVPSQNNYDTSNVVSMREKVPEPLLLMAAATMHEMGRLVEPLAPTVKGQVPRSDEEISKNRQLRGLDEPKTEEDKQDEIRREWHEKMRKNGGR